MFIYLYDHEVDDDVEVDVKVEYATPCSDVYILFYNKNETCSLPKGESAEYHRYTVKKLTNIIGASLKKNDHLYFLQIGNYISAEGTLESFLIKESGSSTCSRYSTSRLGDGEHICSSVRLFNYEEYERITSFLGFEKESTNTFITRMINSDVSAQDYSVYDIAPESKTGSLVREKEFLKFLDSEEIRLSIKNAVV